MTDYSKPINYLNAYLYFCWNYITPNTFNDIFKDTIYNPDYMFQEVWLNKSNCNPATFYANVDSTVRQLIFNYAVEFFRNKNI